ncbi:MAG: sulfite exporter TauE/SafE family protein [Hyphomicrobiales bacterium]
MTVYLFVLVIGLGAGAISGVVGTGGSIILLPLLVFHFGAKQAVPIMAVAGLMANIGKILAWHREVDWRAVAAFGLAGAPAAALGARTLLVLPPQLADTALGAFFLLMIPARHWLQARHFRINLWQLALAGGVIGFLTGVVVSTGPLSVPAFLSYGLTRGAFISTEAAASLAVFASKVATFREFGALPGTLIMHGLIVGASMMAGSFLGKAVVQRMGVGTYNVLLDSMLLIAGLSLLWQAFFPAA